MRERSETFATVDYTGNVVESRSSRVADANADLKFTAGFCFYDLDFEFSIVQITTLYDGFGSSATAEIGYPNLLGVIDCQGDDPALETATLKDGVWTPISFTVVFFG